MSFATIVDNVSLLISNFASVTVSSSEIFVSVSASIPVEYVVPFSSSYRLYPYTTLVAI